MKKFTDSEFSRFMQENEAYVNGTIIRTGILTKFEVEELFDEVTLTDDVENVIFYTGFKDGAAFKAAAEVHVVHPLDITKVFKDRTIHIFIPQMRIMKSGLGVA